MSDFILLIIIKLKNKVDFTNYESLNPILSLCQEFIDQNKAFFFDFDHSNRLLEIS